MAEAEANESKPASAAKRRATAARDAPARPRVVRAERRAQILDAMYQVMASRGLAGASVTEIADAAGIARGALHYFFENKDEITSSLMQRLGGRYRDDLAAYIERRAAAGKRATLVGDVARWHFLGDSDDALRRMSVWIDYWGQAATHPGIRDVVREIQDGARSLLARALVLQRPELAALPENARYVSAAALLAVVEGGLLQWRIASAHLDRTSLGDAVAFAADLAVRAIDPAQVSKEAR